MNESDLQTMENLDPDWWLRRKTSETFITQFKEHVLALAVNFRLDENEVTEVFSGFVIELQDQWFWITASHVVSRIKDLRASESTSINLSRWWDNSEIEGAETVPMSLGDLDCFQFSEELLDIGIARISTFDRTAIEAAGDIIPFTKGAWHEADQSKPEGYYLLGWPSEDVLTDSAADTIEASLACIPVRKIPYSADLMTGTFGNNPNAFYGELTKFAEQEHGILFNIDGMSGGPIISIERKQGVGVVYKLLAVQRSWQSNRGIIRGDLFSVLVSMLEDNQ